MVIDSNVGKQSLSTVMMDLPSAIPEAPTMAIFSTKLGSLDKRSLDLSAPPPIVLRSNPNRDAEAFKKSLEAEFKVHTDRIGKPYNLSDYFDSYDQHVQGAGFLGFVLDCIAAENEVRLEKEKERKQADQYIHDEGTKWLSANASRIKGLNWNSPDFFNDEEKALWPKDIAFALHRSIKKRVLLTKDVPAFMLPKETAPKGTHLRLRTGSDAC